MSPLTHENVAAAVSAMWCEVLGLSSASAQDNFFEVGGTSIQATLLMSRVADELDVVIDPVEIFDAPRLCDIAELVHAALR